jgi:hypothetical protein
MAVELELTLSETETISTSSGSRDHRSNSAEKKLSKKNSMICLRALLGKWPMIIKIFWTGETPVRFDFNRSSTAPVI